MARNKVQYQKGLSFKEFFRQYGTEQQCYEALFKWRWGKGFECRRCGYAKGCINRKRRVYQCHRCHFQTSLTAGTIFHASKLALTTWFLSIYLLTQNKNGVSIMELSRQLGISDRAAWRLKHKLLQVMYERDGAKKLSGLVVMDDAYIGGEHEGGKRGRGSENKTPIVAAVQINSEGHPMTIKVSRVKGFSSIELYNWSVRHLAPGSKVITDGLQCFSSVASIECEHDRIITGGGKQSVNNPVFQWVNTVLGNMKTSFSGTYHAISHKHIPRYLAEFQYKFNRRYDMAAMIPRLAYVALRTQPCPERILVLADFR